MRALVVTKIFPNAAEPLSSPFNRQQFAALGRRCEVEVLATIPWFPGVRWLRPARAPREEVIDGLPVSHPRFLYLPRLPVFSGALYAASLLRAVSRRRFDVILGSWAYPDGVAAVALGRLLRKPVVMKLHGSDIDVLATRRGLRAHLRWALPRATAVVAVSRPLADAATRLGAAAVEVIRNGVDATVFRPRDREECRRRLGLPAHRRWLVQVARLERSKGALDLIDAFARLGRPDAGLALVGDGAARAECERRVAALGLTGQVVLSGALPLDEVPLWMGAAQAVVLASHHEGTPNVLVEALSCGRRVVATAVGGVPDVVHHGELGELVPASDPAALAFALGRALDASYNQARVAALGGAPTWDESATRLHDVLARATLAHAVPSHAPIHAALDRHGGRRGHRGAAGGAPPGSGGCSP